MSTGVSAKAGTLVRMIGVVQRDFVPRPAFEAQMRLAEDRVRVERERADEATKKELEVTTRVAVLEAALLFAGAEHIDPKKRASPPILLSFWKTKN